MSKPRAKTDGENYEPIITTEFSDEEARAAYDLLDIDYAAYFAHRITINGDSLPSTASPKPAPASPPPPPPPVEPDPTAAFDDIPTTFG